MSEPSQTGTIGQQASRSNLASRANFEDALGWETERGVTPHGNIIVTSHGRQQPSDGSPFGVAHELTIHAVQRGGGQAAALIMVAS